MDEKNFFSDLENEKNFDDSFSDKNEREGFIFEEKTAKSFPWIGIFIGLIFGFAVAFAALKLFTGNDKPTNTIPIIENEQGNFREKPENQDTLDFYENAEVYDSMRSFEGPGVGKDNAEEPKKPEKHLIEEPPVQEVKTVPVTKPKEEPVVTKPKPAPKPTPKPTPKPVTKNDVADVVNSVSSSTSSSSAFTGKWKVQILSVKSKSAAEKAWADLKRKYSSILGSVPHAIMQAAVKGDTYYRLRVGGYNNISDANSLCGKLKAKGESCYVVK